MHEKSTGIVFIGMIPLVVIVLWFFIKNLDFLNISTNEIAEVENNTPESSSFLSTFLISTIKEISFALFIFVCVFGVLGIVIYIVSQYLEQKDIELQDTYKEQYRQSLFYHLKRLSNYITSQNASAEFEALQLIKDKILVFDFPVNYLEKEKYRFQMNDFDVLAAHEIEAIKKILVVLEAKIPVTDKVVSDLIHEVIGNLHDVYENYCASHVVELVEEKIFYQKAKKLEVEKEQAPVILSKDIN